MSAAPEDEGTRIAAEDWRPLVDLGRLAEWMDGRGLESGPISEAQALVGGTQNILLRFRRGARRFVLRRPPSHPYLDGTVTMRREARLLAALAGSAVPHPRLIAACDDKTILGAGFYLMEPVDGFSPTLGLPQNYADNPDYRRRMGLAAVDAIVALGAVDHVSAGLADFGKLDNYLERQLQRWRGQLDSYSEYAGWPGTGGLPGIERVYEWLVAHKPAGFRPGIVHGDFQLTNVMFRHDRPEVAAVVDWELATLGDPLIDLAWLVLSWPGPDGSGVNPRLKVSPWQGFPRVEELVARYAEGSGADMSNLRWFSVLAAYKMCVINEGTYARAFVGKATAETGETFRRVVREVLARALGMVA